MIGGMVDTRIAMGFAGHLAAELGCFSFVDLDTPLLLCEDPVFGGYEVGSGRKPIRHWEDGRLVVTRTAGVERSDAIPLIWLCARPSSPTSPSPRRGWPPSSPPTVRPPCSSFPGPPLPLPRIFASGSSEGAGRRATPGERVGRRRLRGTSGKEAAVGGRIIAPRLAPRSRRCSSLLVRRLLSTTAAEPADGDHRPRPRRRHRCRGGWTTRPSARRA